MQSVTSFRLVSQLVQRGYSILFFHSQSWLDSPVMRSLSGLHLNRDAEFLSVQNYTLVTFSYEWIWLCIELPVLDLWPSLSCPSLPQLDDSFLSWSSKLRVFFFCFFFKKAQKRKSIKYVVNVRIHLKTEIAKHFVFSK